jgi:hypothetical protein
VIAGRVGCADERRSARGSAEPAGIATADRRPRVDDDPLDLARRDRGQSRPYADGMPATCSVVTLSKASPPKSRTSCRTCARRTGRGIGTHHSVAGPHLRHDRREEAAPRRGLYLEVSRSRRRTATLAAAIGCPRAARSDRSGCSRQLSDGSRARALAPRAPRSWCASPGREREVEELDAGADPDAGYARASAGKLESAKCATSRRASRSGAIRAHLLVGGHGAPRVEAPHMVTVS